MREISNSALAFLVMVAIVVSVIGTLASLNKLTELGGSNGISGYLIYNKTQQGRANLSVASSVYINLSDSTINLGVIDLFFTNNSDNVTDYWYVQNDGTVNISIEVYTDPAPLGTAQQDSNARGRGPFTTVSLQSGCQTNTPQTCFKVKCNSTESGYDCNNTYYPLYNKTSMAQLIVDLAFQDTVDQAVFGVEATVPPGEPSGEKIQYVTFEAFNSE